MPVLRVVTGDGIIFDHPCTGGKKAFGRTKNCDLPLKDRTVSRYHGEITKTNDGYHIQDLGSYNGKKINGKLIQTAPLRSGDKVQIGLTGLIFREDIPHETNRLDSLLLTTEGEFETGEQRIVESSPGKPLENQLIYLHRWRLETIERNLIEHC